MKDWIIALHFLRPAWLWLLAAAPLIYFSASFQDDVRARCKPYIDAELLDHLVVNRRKRWQLRPVHTLCALIVLGAVALAGPTWKREQQPFSEDKAPLVIALDLSQTMDAIDLPPTRLERTKLKLRDLLAARNGGRTALFVYAGTSHMVLPFTSDHSLLDLYVSSLTTAVMPVPGKDTAAALRAIQDFLKDEPVPGTILFVTDGVEPRAISALEKFAQENGDKNDILVLGVGTSRGGPIRTGDNTFLTGATRARVFSKLDVGELRSLNANGVPTSTLTLNGDDVTWIQRHAQHHLASVQQKDNQTQWINEGYWLTFPIVALAMFWFRKGWTVRWNSAALAAVLILTPGSTLAPGPDAPPPPQSASLTWKAAWMDLWLTPDQQGRYYFEHAQYEKAAEHFEDPAWRGLSFARAGKYQDALNEFALNDSADAWFNQGDALAHLGKYPEAVRAFQEALARRHPWPEAQQNLELVQSLIPSPKKNEEREDPAEDTPDKVQYDEKGKQGKKIKMRAEAIDPAKLAEIWMRNIQTTPADFLRRRFEMQAAQQKSGAAQP
jgi:Ca-activated chloride channel family protein